MKRLLILGVLLLSACGTSPEPDFYTLDGLPASVTLDVALTAKIERPALAAYLDRPDFVTEEGNHVMLNETRNWAEPLDLMIERVLAEDLRVRLPNATIVTEAEDTPIDARFVIETTFDEFNATAGGQVALAGRFMIKDNQTSHLPVNEEVTLTGAGGFPAAMVARLSGNDSQMADRIAATGMVARLSGNLSHVADRIAARLQHMETNMPPPKPAAPHAPLTPAPPVSY